ncbi:uncharacterized protein AB9X84_000815 isoform 1-T1 [Acanthopagrus schlegelii]
MCSVVGCDSWLRNAQRFKLPDDPESRLVWVQFLFEVNRQRLKESSWTDITICSEHFTHDCFDNLTSLPGAVQLTSSAVPSLCIKSEPEEQELPEHPESYQVSAVCKEESDGSASEGVADSHECVSGDCDGEVNQVENLPFHSLDSAAKEEPVETTDTASQYDQPEADEIPSSESEESEPASPAAQESPVPSDASDDFMSDYRQVLQKVANLDIIREKAALLQMKGKCVVNENRLLLLFGRKCPSCGSEVKVEKFTYGLLIVLNRQCLQCEYRHQWKSQFHASIPAGEQLTGGTDVTPLIREIELTDEKRKTATDISEMVAVIDEESDAMDEVSGDEDDADVDEDWDPTNLLDDRLLNDESNEDEDDDDDDLVAGKHTELCSDCGKFFNKQKRHTCEHKIKPYSCNICGKRCVTEAALSSHSRVHDENYEHRCKYCYSPFKTKVDKITHEQTHLSEEKPYKCPECPETFSTNKRRRVHLEVHGGPKQLECHICALPFYRKRALERHLLVHTGERAFKCSVCQRDFNQQSHLKSHMRLHTGERPYKCQHCDKCFNHNVSLKSHVQRYHAFNSDSVDDAGETGQKATDRKKRKRRSTGRPKGRPKRNAAGNLVSGETQVQCSNTKAAKVKAWKTKITRCSDEES